MDKISSLNHKIEKALEIGEDIRNFPLGDCSPSDDPDKQTAYLYGFRDIVIKFLGYAKRIRINELQEYLKNIEVYTNSSSITDAYELKADLDVIIDILEEYKYYPETSNILSEYFVHQDKIESLRSVKQTKFDLTKLVGFCNELNDNYSKGNYLSTSLLLRAIINHIPPIFGHTNFEQVASNASKTKKELYEQLEMGTRKIADLHTHILISKNSPYPTIKQLQTYEPNLEVLIDDVIDILKGYE